MRAAPDCISHCHQFIAGWLPGAMFPSELAWFLESFERSGCDVLLECGRQDGVSTEVFARYLEGTGATVISIDFDADPARAERARARLRGAPVELVSGDIHVEVPKVLRRCGGKKVAVLQDGPKGWEGLATLLAAGVADNVGLIAQHNLHEGHVTRAIFQMVSLRPSFLELTPERDRFSPLVTAEREAIRAKAPNRPIDHTSLGVMIADAPQKRFLRESFEVLRPLYGPWNPGRVAAAWDRGDFDYVPRLRRRVRFTPARFKAR